MIRISWPLPGYMHIVYTRRVVSHALCALGLTAAFQSESVYAPKGLLRYAKEDARLLFLLSVQRWSGKCISVPGVTANAVSRLLTCMTPLLAGWTQYHKLEIVGRCNISHDLILGHLRNFIMCSPVGGQNV